MGSKIKSILDKVLSGGRMTAEECTTLLESHDVAAIGAAADEIRQRKHPENIVTYIIDRNINYTNVCNVVCTFAPSIVALVRPIRMCALWMRFAPRLMKRSHWVAPAS